MSTRTHTSYLSTLPPTTTNGSTTRRLKKEERLDRGGNVLPPQPSTSSSIYRPTSIATNGGTTYRDTGRASSVLGGGSTHGALTKTPRILGGLAGGKEKRLKGREELSRRNMKVDADGVAHDSECELGVFPAVVRGVGWLFAVAVARRHVVVLFAHFRSKSFLSTNLFCSPPRCRCTIPYCYTVTYVLPAESQPVPERR